MISDVAGNCVDHPEIAQDLRELADIMIDRWQRFKASLTEVK
jgi:hypothetical protein